MNILERLKELEVKLNKDPKNNSESELTEYRALRTIANILTSQTGNSFMSSDSIKYLAKQLGWSTKGFKKGKFV